MNKRKAREIHVTQIAAPPGHPMMPNGLPAPSVLDEDQAAAFLQIKPRTLRQYRNERRIKGFKYGRCVRFNIEELERFRRASEQENPA